MSDRVSLDDFNAIPAPAVPGEAESFRLEVTTLGEFVAVEEEGAEALVGGELGAFIPQGGDVMFYGDGGAGKTTLAVDLACHLAAGDDWLGIPVARQANVLLIENEGPRPLYRAKLRRKRDGWTGSPLDDRVQVLERPWGKLSFSEAGWREALAESIRDYEVDIVIAGPVSRLGMNEAGTLQEVRDFLGLVNEARELSARRVAVVLIHHENKGGKVSGAWEGSGDTLLHVQGQGHGRLRLFVQKARWSSIYHATTLQLAWAEGEGFALLEDGPDRPERVWEDIAGYVLEHGGCGWNEVDKAVPGEGTYKRQRRDQMLEEGLLLNVGSGQKFALWHGDDPARPTLEGEPRRSADAVPTRSASATGDGAETATASVRRLRSSDAPTDAVGSTSPDAFDSGEELRYLLEQEATEVARLSEQEIVELGHHSYAELLEREQAGEL